MSKNNNNLYSGIRKVTFFSIVIALIVLWLFIQNQTYECDLPVDTDIFGTYGDFVGGVIGTIFAVYSVYWLIRTFQNQSLINRDIEITNKSIIEANKSTIAANQRTDAAAQKQYYQTELQIFDNKFRIFFDAYLKAVESYTSYKANGRVAFEEIANEFVDTDFDNDYEYKRRSKSATDKYRNFYAEHQVQLSVHLRMLYLLVSLISKSDLEEDDKVKYAKLIRGQMSSNEMLIVRYNCRSIYGQKMQPLCNQFNLTKHISVTRLLEFKKYRTIIEKHQNESEKLLSGLDAMFITLRKESTILLYDDSDDHREYKTSHSYTISIKVENDKHDYIFELKKNRTVVRKGGGGRISPDEKALDCLMTDNQIPDMFIDYLNELFICSNFKHYNEDVKISQQGNMIDNKNEYRFTIKVTNNKRLVLSAIQLRNRDNQIGELEL